MWYWTVVLIATTEEMYTSTGVNNVRIPTWSIMHKVNKNITASNPWQDAKDWVEKNKKEGSEYVILEMFFV